MRKRNLKTFWIIISSGAGLMGASLAITALSGIAPDSTLGLILRFFEELGMAGIIAATAAITLDSLLTTSRIREILGIIGPWEDARDIGLKQVVVNRKTAFREMIRHRIPHANNEIEIMGICVSLFRETRKLQRDRPGSTLLEDTVQSLVEQILKGCRVSVLNLCRYPTRSQRLNYHLGDADLYYWREVDECDPHELKYLNPNRLKMIANEAIGFWIEILVRVAEQSYDKSQEERTNNLNRLTVKEYLALPSLSVYRVDDELYFTPYLVKRHCADVPGFLLVGVTSTLFKQYQNHFRQTIEDPLTSTPIPQEFRRRLAHDPVDTAHTYRTILEKLRQSVQPDSEGSWKGWPLVSSRFEEVAISYTLDADAAKNDL